MPHADACCGVPAGCCCRGGGREVAADERSAAAHMLMAAPVDETLQLAYPDVYLLSDTSGAWGTEDGGKVRWQVLQQPWVRHARQSGAHIAWRF